MSRSSAKIANKVAKSGRTSTRRISEPPRRATRKKKPSKRSATKKRPARKPKKNKRSRPPTRSRTFPRLVVMIVVMMGLGFVSILLLDKWAQRSPEIRERPASVAEPVAEADEGATLDALVDKFIDRLLDRDLPGAKRPTPPPAAKKKVTTAKPQPSTVEVPTKTTADYKRETKPLKSARARKKQKVIDKRARLDALLNTVGVPE